MHSRFVVQNQLQNQAATKHGPPITAQMLREICIWGGTGFVPSASQRFCNYFVQLENRYFMGGTRC